MDGYKIDLELDVRDQVSLRILFHFSTIFYSTQVFIFHVMILTKTKDPT